MKKATKQELREELIKRHYVGEMMSNVCFNWGQGKTGLSKADCGMLRNMQRDWDKIKRAEKP